jgi:hypothetical protein
MSYAKVFELLTDMRNEFGKAMPALLDKAWLEGKVAELKGWIAKIESPPPAPVLPAAAPLSGQGQTVSNGLPGATAVIETVGLAGGVSAVGLSGQGQQAISK